MPDVECDAAVKGEKHKHGGKRWDDEIILN